MFVTSARPVPVAITATALAALLGLPTSANATSVVFVRNTINDCCIANPPGPAVSEFFDNATSASFSGFPTQSFSDPHVLDHPASISIDAKQATSGAGGFPGENDFSFLPGTALGMNGARADAISTSQAPTPGSWQSVVEIRTTDDERASASTEIRESATFDIPAGTSLRFFLDESYRIFISTSGEAAKASIQNRYTLVGPTPLDFRSGSWAPLTCAAAGPGTFCDTGDLHVALPELETGPLAAGRYTFSLDSLTTVSVVPEPPIVLLAIGGLALLACRRRLPRSRA